MSARPETPVDPHYYLHNFLHALDWLSARYPDVLDATEQQFMAQLRALPRPSQALFVRMLMRRGPWFRQSKLHYGEIADVLAAAQPLVDLGWLDPHAPMSVQDLFDLHTHAELKTLLAASVPLASNRNHASARTKQGWLQQLLEANLGERPYRQWHPGAREAVWLFGPHVAALCQRFRLMFFGNLRQTWAEYVLADLGVFRYEPVPFPAAARAFECRHDVDTCLAMQRCRDALDEGLANAQHWIHALVQCQSPNPWLERRRHKLLMHIGQACERAKDHAAAQAAYAHSRYPGARQRHIRVLELQGEHAAAWALAQQARQAPESEAESQQLQRMLPRLARRVGGTRLASQARAAAVGDALRIDIALPGAAADGRVEWRLRTHWHRPEAPVFYVENTLITGLFGLLCWPAVFAPVQGAFFHPFQSAPMDFGAPDFASRRQHEFAQCLAELDDGRYRQTIVHRFHDKQGVQNPLVVWPALSDDLLALALQCMPAEHLRALFLRLQADPQGHRTGLPDLIRFWPEAGRYELVEVKAPGDKLQDNQIRWLQWFVQHGIAAKVCHVTWADSPQVVPCP